MRDAMIDAIRAEVPDYAQPVGGAFGFGRNLHTGVEQAMREFAALIEDPGHDRSRGREIFFLLGQGEAREGRGLEPLLRAYRVGARAAWGALATEAASEGLDAVSMAALAERMFDYVDELSAVSAEGYAGERAGAATEAERASQRLARLLVEPGGLDVAEVESLAARAGWGLPAALSVLVWREQGERRIPARLPMGTLASRIDDLWIAVISDPEAPGRRAELELALDGLPAALGPGVGWRDAAVSAERARLAHALLERGAIEASGIIVSEDHLASLIVHRDEEMLARLSETILAPLAAESERSRERLLSTLRAWLELQGVVSAMAEALFVHPQTIRYRVSRLHELFAGRLDDPGFRFELSLALRA